MNTRRLIPVLPLFLVLALGCSGNKNAPSTVSGKITYKGEQVTKGTVTFHPAEGPPYPIAIGSDGTYSMTDVPTGDMVVTVETESAKQQTMPTYGGRMGKQAEAEANKGEAKGRMGPGGGSPAPSDFQQGGGKYTKIPDKYSKKETSPLKTNLTRGKNTFDIPLED
jgi:hypothetical protein